MSRLMEIAAEAAKRVALWSDAKKEYARKVMGDKPPPRDTYIKHEQGR